MLEIPAKEQDLAMILVACVPYHHVSGQVEIGDPVVSLGRHASKPGIKII